MLHILVPPVPLTWVINQFHSIQVSGLVDVNDAIIGRVHFCRVFLLYYC